MSLLQGRGVRRLWFFCHIVIAVSKERLLSLDRSMVNPKGPPPRERLFPEDGIKFLELRPGLFRGSYFNASLIEEVKCRSIVTK